jgi:hypothetical protein
MTQVTTLPSIKALADMISSAVETVLSEYALGHHEVPELDVTQPGPFDRPEDASERLQSAIRIIEAASAQLCATVASPGHVITNVSA